jgi:uncharacterized membrane protein YdbT with pleckstrin-like domain
MEFKESYRERKRWLFFGLPWTFTVYTVNGDFVTRKAGLFRTVEDDCYLYKIQDVKLVKSLCERIFRLGTIVCFTGDATDPELKLIHIRNSHEIKDYILDASEKARIKRRTLHTLDIGGSADAGGGIL